MNVKKILVVVAIGIIVGAAVVLCLRSNVPDKVIGADTVREQLDEAIRLERQTIRAVELAADTTAGVRGEIEAGRAGVRAATKSNLQLKEMIEQESSLENARASLEQFEKEEQGKLNRSQQEKTAAWIIAGLLLCVCICK